MSNSALTPRQQQILHFIQQYLKQHQCPPTQAEITLAMGFRSRTAAKDHLRALEKKGVLELRAGSSRGIQLLQVSRPATLPLIGRVAAGQPILALENIITQQRIDPELFSPAADYLLQVVGESMRDAGIANDDLLAVQQSQVARNGQIVVARIDDEVTVKRFMRRGDVVQLLPANPDFQPITVDLRAQELCIEGVMVGLIRCGAPT